MFEVRVETEFAAAHFLKDYHGKCENLHGHNYKVYAHAKGMQLSSGGMLLDFTILKNSLREVCKKLDHSCLNDLACFENNPSAERIAKYIFDSIIEKLIESGYQKESAFLNQVDVFETATSKASYIKDV